MAINDDIEEMVTQIDEWLDNEVPAIYTDSDTAQDWQRIAKIQEESGEAVRAFMNLTGANPRRGTSGSIDDVTDELADVVLTAVVAIQHFTKDWSETERILWDKLISVFNRVPARAPEGPQG